MCEYAACGISTTITLFLRRKRKNMKKFFKALALVLALTLVIGTIPASAAINFELKQKSKIIYIDGSKGTKKDADGNVVKCKTVNKYTVTKLINGFDADTMDVKITTADKTIASKNNKYDRVYAKGIGTTTATIKIYYKDDLKTDIGTLKLKIKVKKNATDLPYYVADSELNLIDVTEDYTFACNTDYYIVLNRYAYLDPTDLTKKVKVDTDKRALTGKEDEVDIVAGGKAGNIFKVNFKKAGKITLKATAYQSGKFDQPTVEKEITVKAGYTALAVAQASLNKAVVTFASPVNKGNLANDNFKLYTKVASGDNTTEIIASSVKGISFNDDEPEKAFVEFNSNFAADKEYFVSYDGKEVGSFKAIKVTADSVKFIELVPNQEFEVGTTGTLKYVLLDENRIDITAAYNGALNGTIEAKLADTADTTSNIWGLDIVLGKVDTTYDIDLAYSWYDSTGIAQKVTGQGVVRCVAKKVWEQVSFKGLLTDGSKAILKDAKTINADCVAVKHFALGDADAQLQVAIGFTLRGETKYDTLDTKNTEAYESYRAEAGDPNVVMVVAGNKVHANTVGTTDIVIYGSRKDANGNYVEDVVGSVPVIVEATRAAKQFKVNVNKATLNQAYAADAVEFDLIVLDQYDEEMSGKKATVKQIKADGYKGPTFADTVAFSAAGNKKEWILDDSNLIKAYDDKGNVITATIIVEFECEGMKYRVSNIDCGYTTKADRQQLNVSGTELKTGFVNKADATYDATTGDRTVDYTYLTISLNGLANNKYAVSGAAVSFQSGKVELEKNVTATENYYKYVVLKDGAQVSDASKINLIGNAIFAVIPTDLVASGSAMVASGSAIKLAAGTYTVDLYEYKVNTEAKTATPTKVDSKTFKVTDNQAQLEVKALKVEGIGADLDNVNVIKNCFEFKFNGAVVTDVDVNFTVTGDKTQARVANVSYTVYNADLGTFKVTTNVGITLRK
jgi:hypothetical protein